MKNAILALIGLIVFSGCQGLVIEKRRLLVSVPPESDEVHLYYIFEGISLLDENRWAKSDLDELRSAKFTFFPVDAESPLLKLCEFEDLRFFVDPVRKRQLCADRRMTIRNRSEFAKLVNHSFNDAMKKKSNRKLEFNEQAFKDEIKRAHDKIPLIEAWLGPNPSYRLIHGLLEILEKYDDESIKLLIDAPQGDFRWLRFEPDSVQLVLPATVECAKRIATDPRSIEWLTRMRANIFPIELLCGDDGIVIELGIKEKVISLGYTDNRPHAQTGESKIAQLAENPKPIIVNGKAETADGLVEQFILEKAGFRRWNDATGKFSVMARFGGIVGGKVVLVKESGRKAYVARDQLGIADQDYLDAVIK